MLSPVKDMTLLTELLATKMVNAAKTMVTAAEKKVTISLQFIPEPYNDI